MDRLISLQAVLDAFGLSEKTRKYGGDHSGYNTIMLYEVQDIIESLPSVSVAEKTGRWKKIKSGDKNFPESIVCSRCGYENSYINEWNFNNEPLSKVFKTSKYCPNCGAKMVEPQESEGEVGESE